METDQQPDFRRSGIAAHRGPWIAGCVCLAVFLVLYLVTGYASGYGQIVDGHAVFIRRSLLALMRKDYRMDEGEWGFGYFVPLAAAGLFWFRREELLATPVRPALGWGAAVLVFGFVLYWAGYRGEQKYFGYAAGQILILGAILWFLGWTWFRKVFWLWALIGMMWPWRFLISRISSPLQLVMAKLTSAFLNLIGVGNVANGSAVMTETRDPVSGGFINMDIDVACSGMRSLFALVMIGLVFAFLRVRVEWKRWVLMAFVPLVAIAGNFVRMLLLYGGSRAWGTAFAIGKDEHHMSRYHMFAGLMVFVVALILLSILVEFLNHGLRVFRRAKVVRSRVTSAAPETP
jgi:exosortase